MQKKMGAHLSLVGSLKGKTIVVDRDGSLVNIYTQATAPGWSVGFLRAVWDQGPDKKSHQINYGSLQWCYDNGTRTVVTCLGHKALT